MKALLMMTIAMTIGTKTAVSKLAPSRTIWRVTSMLSFALIGLGVLSGCQQADQSQPQTAAQQHAQPGVPGSDGQARTNPSNPSQPDPAQASFLESVEAGDVAAVQTALDAGTDPNTKTAQGLSAIELATAQGQSGVVEALLETQPALGVGETQPRTPQYQALLLAARGDDRSTIQVLIDRGVDINVQDPHTQQTALLAAANRGHLETVSMLLENGANPDVRDARGYPALVQAAAQGDVDMVEVLLKHGANPGITEDINSWTALMMAADSSNAEMVELLVNYGADVNSTNGKGKSALDIAYQKNDEATIAAIEAEPQSPTGLASAKKPATGLTLVPSPANTASDTPQETEQPDPTAPAVVATAPPVESEPLAPATEVVEDTTTAAETQKGQQITQLLARAQQQFQKKNLTTPKGDNALDTCLEIFALAPGHADTVELVRKMEQQYRDWARTTKSAKRRKAYTEKAQELAAMAQ